MKHLILLLALVLCAPAYANTAAQENGLFEIGSLPKGSSAGNLRVIKSGLLCSDYAAGDTNCTPLEFGATVPYGDVVVFYLFNDGQGFDCSSGSCVKQTGGSDDCSGTPSFEITTAPFLGTGDAPPPSARAIASSFTLTDASATARVITLNLRDTPLDRYVFTNQTGTDTACADLDIAFYVYERK